MQASTEEAPQDAANDCTSAQVRAVKELVNALTTSKILESQVFTIAHDLKALAQKVDDNDKKHEASSKVLNEALLQSNAQTNKSLALLTATIAPIIPLVEKAGKVQSFSNKWSPILCVLLILSILATSKAEMIFQAFKNVFL